MFSAGIKYVYTHPLMGSSSKHVVVKKSLNWGQLKSILVLPVLIGNLSLIRSPIQVLHKFGTYQCKAMSLCFLMYSSSLSVSVLVRTTVGFRAAFCWFEFGISAGDGDGVPGVICVQLSWLLYWLVFYFLLCMWSIRH